MFCCSRRVGRAMLGALLFAIVPRAQSATIGLSGNVESPRVIIGGKSNIFSYVSNTDTTGAPLNYTINYTYPYGTTPNVIGTRAADGGAGSNPYVGQFDSTGQNYGANTITVTVTSSNATNSPKSVVGVVNVLAPGQPFVKFGNGAPQPLYVPAAQAPAFTPEAFGATGGGESYVAKSWIINDPPYPTAGMDLDSITSSGSPQISIDLTPFTNLAADDDPDYGHPFNISVSKATPGNFSTTFFLNFSDEDIPGAREFGSIATQFTVTATVTPERESGLLIMVSLMALVRKRRGYGLVNRTS